jgi:hypothetical protein
MRKRESLDLDIVKIKSLLSDLANDHTGLLPERAADALRSLDRIVLARRNAIAVAARVITKIERDKFLELERKYYEADK